MIIMTLRVFCPRENEIRLFQILSVKECYRDIVRSRRRGRGLGNKKGGTVPNPSECVCYAAGYIVTDKSGRKV